MFIFRALNVYIFVFDMSFENVYYALPEQSETRNALMAALNRPITRQPEKTTELQQYSDDYFRNQIIQSILVRMNHIFEPNELKAFVLSLSDKQIQLLQRMTQTHANKLGRKCNCC